MSMATMVMATVSHINNGIKVPVLNALIPLLILSPVTLAGEWTFDPNIGLTETYSNNVELTNSNKESSLVSQAFIGLETEYISNAFKLSFTGTETFAAYSHDSDLNDDFQEANLDLLWSIWDGGPEFIARSSITNISKDETSNSLADLVSSDTIQQKNHFAGFQYNIDNNHHLLNSSIVYNIIETEDNIGESEGYTAIIDSSNGRSARNVFWQADGQYSYRENKDLDGENYTVEIKFGAITTFHLNPFVRYYNEDIKGSLAGTSPGTTPSWGPGLRFIPTRHFSFDLSYNYVEKENTTSDDYVAASLDWQPSPRTSLFASYSKRFFGDSYEFDFQHKAKRLTNSITYKESIEVFDRNTYFEEELGLFWCPVAEGSNSVSLTDCFAQNQPQDDANYALVPFSSLTPVENNEFTLNKRLAWHSVLSLSRTDFSFNISAREREALSTGIIDEYLDISFDITRRISPRSDISLITSYFDNTFDKENPEGPRQTDKYKVVEAIYNKKLAHSLSAFVSLQFLDRESSRVDRTYTEARASINITKEF